MKEYARDLWARANRAMQTARRNYNDEDYDAVQVTMVDWNMFHRSKYGRYMHFLQL